MRISEPSTVWIGAAGARYVRPLDCWRNHSLKKKNPWKHDLTTEKKPSVHTYTYIYSGHILVLMFFPGVSVQMLNVHIHVLLRFGCSHCRNRWISALCSQFVDPFVRSFSKFHIFFEPSNIQVQQCIELHDCLENHQSFKLLGWVKQLSLLVCTCTALVTC